MKTKKAGNNKGILRIKFCLKCGKAIPKPANSSSNYYYKRKFCSEKCYFTSEAFKKRMRGYNDKQKKERAVKYNCKICGHFYYVCRAYSDKFSKKLRYSTCGNESCKRAYLKIRCTTNGVLAQKPEAREKMIITRRKNHPDAAPVSCECGCGCGSKFFVGPSRKKRMVGERIFLNREHFENWFHGERSYLWKGGISCEPYSLDWTKRLKKEIRKRDNWTCQLCQGKNRKLDVHHIDYNKKNCVPGNLITLCHPCHCKTNINRNYWMNYFTSNIQLKMVDDNLSTKSLACQSGAR